METTTELEMVPIDKLVPYPNNARTHSPEQINKLRGSLREFGFINPIIIDRDYGVIAGHGRLMAAQAENIEKVPCVFVDHLTEAQKKAYILADNRMAEDAGWDEEMLRAEIEGLQETNFDLSLTGFDSDEIDSLFEGEAETEAKDDDFDMTTALENASFVERGDIWTVGKHRLMCGDATVADDVEKLMNGKIADLVVTDPPYGVEYTSSRGLSIENDGIQGNDFYQFLLDAYTNLINYLKQGGVAYIFHADTEQPRFENAFTEAGFYLAQVCVWVKSTFAIGRQDYQWKHESILYGWKPGASHYFLNDRTQSTVFMEDEVDFNAMKKSELVEYLEELRKSYKDATTVIEEKKPARNEIHPTMKPLALIGKLIGNSSKQGWLVLDTFGGSGSTMMTCEQMNRVCYMMELDEKYASAILRRYVEMTGDEAGVYVERNGETIPYTELVKEVEKRR